MGKIKADYARSGCAEFLKRLGRYHKVEHIEVRDVSRTKGRVEDWKKAEASALLKHIPNRAVTVVLDENGKQWSSQGLAQWIQGQENQSQSTIAFLLGGPDGHDPQLIKSAHRVWSLGQLTLPHELARLLVLEQVYRASTLLSGHPYHRA